jgi:CDP-glucose 4,6-dehydratase
MGLWNCALEELEMTLNASFWRGKRVLITGHTGFKGGWLAIWLQRLGAEVTGIALAPNTTPSLFELANVARGMASHICDIRDSSAVAKLINAAQPDVIFHLAAQPLVRISYKDPLSTFATNVMGTANVLDALRGQVGARVAVMVTTDKVYRNQENHSPFCEGDTLGGHDPYSASKAASEIVIASYRDAYLREYGLAVASARAGNVIGGGDWSEDRLIPDAVRAWSCGQPMVIRNPQATRPWQHVLEPLAGYLTLAQRLWIQPELADAYNFGPYTNEAVTVEKLINMACSAFGVSPVRYENSSTNLHEASWLALNVAKASEVLGVNPKWRMLESVQRTMEWYKAQIQGLDARKLCESEIVAYEELL